VGWWEGDPLEMEGKKEEEGRKEERKRRRKEEKHQTRLFSPSLLVGWFDTKMTNNKRVSYFYDGK
jgi:hypothetical protein